MKITMLTNTYLPHVGGVANSVREFSDGYRERGHEVLVVAPEYDEEAPRAEERNILRLPALKNIQESNFSLALPVSPKLRSSLREFGPDLLHSHHPFVIGDTALKLAASEDLPLVFTYHTMYEHYTHYSPVSPGGVKEFIIELATGYANLCDRVVAPSESVARILRDRGVRTPVVVIPTGVNAEKFGDGDPGRGRRENELPQDVPVIGHVGRLAPEKNLEFLGKAFARCLRQRDDAHALIVGDGDTREDLEGIFDGTGVSDQVRMPGVLKGQKLVDAYHAMDVFGFASKTETQGMALAEALAAGCPVVALDAPGAREIVRDGQNGRLLQREDAKEFADALGSVLEKSVEQGDRLAASCRSSVEEYRAERCIGRMLGLYEGLLEGEPRPRKSGERAGTSVPETLEQMGRLWVNRLRALARAFVRERPAESEGEKETQ